MPSSTSAAMASLRVDTARPSSPLSSAPASPSLSSSTSSAGPDYDPSNQVTPALSARDARDGVVEDGELALGRLDEAAYERLLPVWRNRIRRILVTSLEREMPYLVKIQSMSAWHPWLSPFFLQTSLLGTHTFFMVCVPMPFWFGNAALGRGLLYVLAGGGYLTSVLKDSFCVPRPYSPPLVRLSVGNHALEYGFPSTHSCTTVSMAFYLGELVHRYHADHAFVNGSIYILLGFITVSVVFGRLYTGMHSITDISVGSIIGLVVWLLHWTLEDAIEAYTVMRGYTTIATIIPSILFLVFVHPAPAEDCPCFEDAVAFLSVVIGLLVGKNLFPADFTGHTYGGGGEQWTTFGGLAVWVGAIVAKLALGVLAIFTWRLIAKEVCHAILPPIFRFCSSLLLPRRHYLKATEYDAYKKVDGLHPIPSILDLPSLQDLDSSDKRASGSHGLTLGDTISSSSSGADDSSGAPGFHTSHTSHQASLRNRHANGGGGGGGGTAVTAGNGGPLERVRQQQKLGVVSRSSSSSTVAEADEFNATAGAAGPEKGRKTSEQRQRDLRAKQDGGDGLRRDADVLTKVFVYAGIGAMAEIVVPATFAALGLTV